MEGSEATGLTHAEARRLLQEHGPNRLRRDPPPQAWRVLIDQLRSPMVGLLAVAAVVAGLLGEVIDAGAIAAIVVLNAVVGFLQEYRAERALLALRRMTAPRARVLREGSAVQLPAEEVVPGDLLLLEAGDLVAADAHLLEAHELRVVEALLTGESLPVVKSIAPTPPDAPLPERTDRVFAGTSVAGGAAVARVEATGMDTEMGRIAALLSEVEVAETPLQVRLAEVTKKLLFASLAVVGLVGVLGLWRGEGWLDVLLVSVSLAVAAVPEGLPAVVTIALAVGVQRMAGRHVLVRRLAAVETLGAVSVICTDKTGTLTAGHMAVRDLVGADRRALLYAAAACCDADLDTGVGDPTELAILAAAAERGIRRGDVERDNPRVEVHPFDSDRKRMSIHRADGQGYVKGAVEAVLPLCTSGVGAIEDEATELAGRGMRVLAVARGARGETGGLTCLGLLALADPPRPEAIAAVAASREAGIRTVMITGDHPVTARAIARELGILTPELDPDEVVHARVSPEEKLRIVRHWKRRGAVVAMTGDGVNDAPAIREAHVGIAMGRTGTEVTREAAAVVLTDDNFASIVEGVREGRNTYRNIRKTLLYLLTGNAAEILVMLVTQLAGLPLPLLPLHLLWVNLVTDGLPALALVTDPPAPDTLRQPPRDPEESMLGGPQWRQVAFGGVVEALVVTATFAWILRDTGDLVIARSYAFSTLVYSELLRAFAARSRRLIFWEVGAFTNLWLLGVVGLSGVLQAGLHHVPAVAGVFDLAPLGVPGLAICVLLGLIPVTVLEVGKLLARAFAAPDGA